MPERMFARNGMIATAFNGHLTGVDMKAFKRRTAARKDIPDHPGLYYWSEYRALVTVVMRRGGLYVTPPIKGGIEIKITPNIAGRFEKRH